MSVKIKVSLTVSEDAQIVLTQKEESGALVCETVTYTRAESLQAAVNVLVRRFLPNTKDDTPMSVKVCDSRITIDVG